MKKILIIVCGLTLGLIAHSQQVLCLEDGSLSADVVSTAPTRDVESVSDGVVVKYVFKNAFLQPDESIENTYWWKVDGFGISDTPTQPSTLSRIDRFTIPNGKEASVEIVSCDYVDYNYELTPARAPLFDDGTRQDDAEEITPIAVSDSWFPVNVIDEFDIQSYRGVGIYNVKVSPIQYNSYKKIVRAYKSIEYKVAFSDAVSLLSESSEDRHAIAIDDPYLQNATLNGYSPAVNRAVFPPVFTNITEYMIVSVPKYASAVNSFVEWKRLLGHNVYVVLKDNWTPDSVKYYVQSQYEKSYLLYYLLIIGDHEDVPSNRSSLSCSHVTDLPYVCMNDSKYPVPSMLCGRLPVRTEAEALTVVNKIIDYEKSPITTPSFYSTGVNCSFFQDKGRDGYADRRFAQTSEEVRDYLMKQGKTVQRIYTTPSNVNPTHWNKGDYSKGEAIPSELLKPTFAWNGNATDINNAINSGAFYVLHRDHGSVTGWCDPAYNVSNINQLSNGNKLPIVFSMNCLTGKFDEPTCFAEAFLRKPSGGCAAIFAASEVSLSGFNDVLTGGIFDAIWPSPGLIISMPQQSLEQLNQTPKPTYRLGQILNQGMDRMFEIYGSSLENSRYTREIFHCFGDPSMLFPTTSPSTFSNVSCQRLGSKVKVAVPNETAIITFYNHETGIVESYSGSYATCTPCNSDYVSVCVSGHNKIPYINYGEKPYSEDLQKDTITSPETISKASIKIGSNRIISCSPNPTQGEITFSYDIDDMTNDAYILICDLSGNIEMKVEGLVGQSSVSTNVSSLRGGMHIVTLVVNQEIQDSKQIIVNR